MYVCIIICIYIYICISAMQDNVKAQLAKEQPKQEPAAQRLADAHHKVLGMFNSRSAWPDVGFGCPQLRLAGSRFQA